MDGFWALGPFLIPIVAIVGGIIAGIVATVTRGRVRELEIRERIAMIERGMVPPPESDPEGFDRRLHSMQQFQRGHVHMVVVVVGDDNGVNLRECVEGDSRRVDALWTGEADGAGAI